ncbi:glutathione S-transferase [Aspergillus saccharolyticus JOP 1030-1]|uniref:Glutathione S-transferase n=1 Tax=Aspergillus saccharolyticus JOP 1030-1 TaxID=1450539 RepID=A0A319AD03_9EURO|nr:glutathione S-transferase [Aspergillus saccharolyticus JOP 1030-1]PYH49468.1 glutathione S-transferase [Aspergillus saccharolyticus JOP 1030-1]
MTDPNKGAKITLYWLAQSRSHRILWLLEALHLTYELKIYHRGPDKLAPRELKEIHPLGKSPVLTIQPATATATTDAAADADKPIVLAESGLIIEYLLDHFGENADHPLIPARYPLDKPGGVGGETEAWFRYRYYMHYAEGSLMPFLVMQLVMDTVKNPPIPFFLKPLPRIVAGQVEKAFLERNIAAHLDFLETQLRTSPNGGPYLCGDVLTAADIMMSFPVIAMAGRLSLEGYPTLSGYAERLQQEAGYVAACRKIEEVDGKFEASL